MSEAVAPTQAEAVVTTTGGLGPARSASEFRRDKFLGKGTYGAVWKVTRLASNKVYALKEIDMRAKKQSEREESVNEIRLLASARHPNIIRYRDSFFDNDHLFIITDFADKGDLSVVIAAHKKAGTTLPEERIWSIFIQLSMGLEYLHRRQILHRDLKASNVFLKGTPETVKIGDLGVAKLLKQSSTQTQVGTPFYISPEIWRKLPYNAKSDVWSLGCVLYEMATLHHPFSANSPKELAQKILRGRYAPIHGYSRELSDVIGQLLCVDTVQRPAMHVVLALPAVTRRMDLIPASCRPAPATPPSGGPSSSASSTAMVGLADDVLGTIKVPRNLIRLTSALPPPAYMTPPSLQRDLEAIGAEVPAVSRFSLDVSDEMPPSPQTPSRVPPPLPIPPIASTTATALSDSTSTTSTATTAQQQQQQRQMSPATTAQQQQQQRQMSPASAQRERDKHNLAVQRVIAHAQRSRRRSSMFVIPESLGSRDKNLALALHALPAEHAVSPPALPSVPMPAPVPVPPKPRVVVAARVSPPLVPPKLSSPAKPIATSSCSSHRTHALAPVPAPVPALAPAPVPVAAGAFCHALRDMSNAAQQPPPPLPTKPVIRCRPSLAPASASAPAPAPDTTAIAKVPSPKTAVPHYLMPRQSVRRTSVTPSAQAAPSTNAAAGAASSSARRKSVALWRP